MVNTREHITNIMQCFDRVVDAHRGVCTNVKDLVSNFVFDSLGDNLFSTKFNSQKHGPPQSSHTILDLLELTYETFLKPWTYFFNNLLVNTLLNINIAKVGFKLVFGFKKFTKTVSSWFTSLKLPVLTQFFSGICRSF